MELITTHTNSDFDSLGGMIAASRLYPDAVLSFPGSQEKGVRDFIASYPDYLPPFVKARDIDLNGIRRLVIVDCSDAARIGRFSPLTEMPEVEVHIYDHHTEEAGRIRQAGGLVRACGAVSSIMALILKERGLRLTPEESTIMLIGIYEDTGKLLYPGTLPDDCLAAAWLLEQGAQLNVVADFVAQELTSVQIELLNRLLKNLRTVMIRDIPVSIASASAERYVSDIAGLAHTMLEMENLDALFLLLEMEGRTHIVARSRLREVNAGEIMKRFNGGGHPAAGYATVTDCSHEEALARLEKTLTELVKPAVTAYEVMSSPVKTAPSNITISEAMEYLARYNCNAMPVMDGSRMVGIISRKTVEKAIYHQFASAPVTDFMHTEFMRGRADTPLSDIQEYMVTGNRRFVPIFEGEELRGAVTRTDILRHMHMANRKVHSSPGSDQGKSFEVARNRDVSGIMKRRLPSSTVELLKAFGENGDRLGLQVYAVGGFVRDMLLGMENLDMDITVEGDGIFFAEKFAEENGCRVRSHPVFGTAVLLFPDGGKVDVASTRLEYYESPGVLPTVERSSLRHDMYRRDFTINTLAININRNNFGLLIDYYGGLQDIHEKVVRVLHNLSFIEDPTRLFRAIRFEQRLGFHIAPHTENLMKTGIRMDMPARVSGARILGEIKLILQEKEPVNAINRMAQFGLTTKIHPSLKITQDTLTVLNEAARILAWFRMLYLDQKCEEWLVTFLALCNSLKQEFFEQVCGKLSIPARMAKDISSQRRQVISTLDAIRQKLKHGVCIHPSDIYRWFCTLSPESVLYLAARSGSEDVRRFTSLYMTRLREVRCSMDGKGIMALGCVQGPAIREIKEKLLMARLDGVVTSDDEEVRMAAELISLHPETPDEKQSPTAAP